MVHRTKVSVVAPERVADFQGGLEIVAEYECAEAGIGSVEMELTQD